MKKIEYIGEYVTLNQFLKMADIVMSGGEGKVLILKGDVMVNGDIETRRGKKLRDGDIVTVKGNKEQYIAQEKN